MTSSNDASIAHKLEQARERLNAVDGLIDKVKERGDQRALDDLHFQRAEILRTINTLSALKPMGNHA